MQGIWDSDIEDNREVSREPREVRFLFISLNQNRTKSEIYA